MRRLSFLLLIVMVLMLASGGSAFAESPFAGTYKGTFVGNFKGEWTCTVDAEGKIADWTISLAPQAKGSGKIENDGKLTVAMNAGGRETVWSATVTPDLKVMDGKLNLGGTFEGQGQKSAAAAPGAPKAPASAPDAAKSGLKVVTVGTGTPLVNLDRNCAATLVMAGDKGFLFDTGRGVVNGLFKAKNPDLTAVLFTHYHSDHFGELGELLVTRAISGAKPLKVIGPVGANKIVAGFQALYALDDSYRKAHHKDKYSGLSVEVQESQPGVVYDDGEVKIRMFAADHEPADPAMAYRLDYKGQSVVISGDTKKVPQMVEMAKGVDILVHDALNRQLVERGLANLQANPRVLAMTKEMMEHHASTLEVAEIARDAGVKKLVLTHLVPSIPAADPAEQLFVQGMAEIYKGLIVVGRDGMVVEAEPVR